MIQILAHAKLPRKPGVLDGRAVGEAEVGRFGNSWPDLGQFRVLSGCFAISILSWPLPDLSMPLPDLRSGFWGPVNGQSPDDSALSPLNPRMP